jgi:hypothetical protein
MDDTALSFALYARPSFWEGMARIIDAGGSLNEYNQSLNWEVADRRALRADWMAVGNAIRAAMSEYEEQQSGTAVHE